MAHTRTLWILLTIAVLLALGIWLLPSQQTPDAPPPLTDISPSSIDRIRISNNNGPSFEMQLIDGAWRMTEPYQIEANTPRIEILLDLLATPSQAQFPVPASDLEQFGLVKPLATVEFNHTRLVMGGTHPSNYHRYIQHGDQLHLIRDLFPHHLLARAEDYVSHRIFGPDEVMQSIRGSEWRLERQTTGEWRLASTNASLDSNQISESVEAWNQSWAKKVLPIPKPAIPDQTFTIELAGQPSPLTVEIIHGEKNLLLIRRDRGVAYQLPPRAIFYLPQAAESN